MKRAEDKRTEFRALINGGDVVIAPGVYDCVSARVAEQAGFGVAIVTGAGIAASVLGYPDVGLVTMTESLNQTRNIARAIDIPLIADCDTGYGNPVNVARTVEEFESAGVSVLFIEDQVAPKKCGHFAGKLVIPAEEMVQKIRAAADARTDSGLVLMARTDARATSGVDEAIRRSRLYVEAGAEMLFVEAPETEAELVSIARELTVLGVPLMVNLVEGGKTPLLPVDRLAEIGFRLVTFSGTMQKTAIRAMQRVLASLQETGTVDAFYPESMLSLDERSALLDMQRFTAMEERYAAR